MSSGGFSVEPGVLGRIARAGTKSEGYPHTLSGGDLSQMGKWDRFLRSQGMDVGNRDVYPAFRSIEDYKRALELLWQHRIEGWWNLERELVQSEICTNEEFRAALNP